MTKRNGKNGGRHKPPPPPPPPPPAGGPNPKEPEWFAPKSGPGTAMVLAPRDGRFQQGHDPRRGHGPNRGRGGRPTAESYAWMREVVYDPRVRERVELILFECPDPMLFLRCLEILLGYLKAPLARQDEKPVDEEPVGFTLEVG